MQWLLGNLFLLSVILVIAGTMWLYGAVMWALGLPPDDHRYLNVVAAIIALWCGYRYAKWALRQIDRMEYRRVLR
jgi:hypothetical protein